jgi:hypothetical protein
MSCNSIATFKQDNIIIKYINNFFLCREGKLTDTLNSSSNRF